MSLWPLFGIQLARCFDDGATPYTVGVRDRLVDRRAVVPSIWPLEAANATVMGGRRKRPDEARSRRLSVLLEALPIVVDDDADDRASTDIVHLARTYPLSADDAAYLELAIRRDRPSACNDGKLKTAAAAAGDVRFSPT